jgi:uncharacterized protein YjdB
VGSAESVGQRDIHRWAPSPARLALLVMVAIGGCSGATDSRPVGAIHIQPATAGMVVERQTTLRATAVDASGKPIAISPMHWSSADPAIATVSGAGVVSALTPGRVNIAASADGVTGIAIVTVSPLDIADVVVLPETLTVMQNATGQLSAAAFAPSGDAVPGLSVVWGSSRQSIATVDTTGKVTGVSPGTSTVTAAMAGRVASATVVVQAPPKKPAPKPAPAPAPPPAPAPAPAPPGQGPGHGKGPGGGGPPGQSPGGPGPKSP